MKKFLLIAFILSSFHLVAQHDIILKTNGEEMVGKVTKIGTQSVNFIYQNETIEYEVANSDILKITFSSGRIQYFTKPTDKSANVSTENHHNKVAILPFGYIKDQETSNVTMSLKIQQETYTIFKAKAAELEFQDPTTTNALLYKAGVDNNNLQGYTMGEICDILGVEYVVQGLVSVSLTSQSNYGNSSTTSSSKNKKASVDKDGKIIGNVWTSGNKTQSNTSSSSTSVQNYATNITMNIYNDKGDNIFSQNHQSFWQTEDAYKITLSFLAKRSPIFKR